MAGALVSSLSVMVGATRAPRTTGSRTGRDARPVRSSSETERAMAPRRVVGRRVGLAQSLIVRTAVDS